MISIGTDILLTLASGVVMIAAATPPKSGAERMGSKSAYIK